MIERFVQGKVRWISLKNPTSAEIKEIMNELDLSPLFMNDLGAPISRNNAQQIDSAIKLTLDFPTVKYIDADHPHEVKFIVSERSLLTVQYDEISAIDKFKRQIEVTMTLRRTQKNISGVTLFVSLVNHLYESAYSKLDYIESKLKDIETNILKNSQKQMVFEISDISRKLITFKHKISTHEDVFREARPFFENVYGTKFSRELQNIQGQYFTLLRRTNNLSDILTALRESNTAMITIRQNEVMKNLTIMAFITFPLTLISSIFGMNTTSTPLVGGDGDFWIVIGFMFFATCCFFIFFKSRDWI